MTKLINEAYPYNDKTITEYSEFDHDKIRDLLLGHKVAKVADDHLELDDGTVVRVVANEGCGGCASGWYGLTELNDCDNIITAVEFEEGVSDDESEWERETIYSVFVVAEDKRINLYAVEGDDGNGYYGTGYRLLVRFPAERGTT